MRFLVATFLLMICSSGYAQKRAEQRRFPEQYYEEIGISVGIHDPFEGNGMNPATVLGVQYARFSLSNIGFRMGVNYYMEMEGVKDFFAVPLRFAWRSAYGSLRDAPQNAAYAVASGYDRVSWGDVLLAILPKRVELNAGITPGYLWGDHASSPAHVNETDEYADSYAVRRNFTCSLDVSLRLTYRIWRFGFSIVPTYSYYLTDNFRRYSSRSDLNGMHPSASFLGVAGELSFCF